MQVSRRALVSLQTQQGPLMGVEGVEGEGGEEEGLASIKEL